MKRLRLFLLVVCIGLLVACDSSEETPAPSENTNEAQVDTDTSEVGDDTTPADDTVTNGSNNGQEGYPGVSVSVPDSNGYPGGVSPLPEGASETLPDPERMLPEPALDTGAVGGVIIRELTEGGGFVPVIPVGLYLGEVVYDEQGVPRLISRGDESPSAQIFQTGVFLFNEVPPGEYGLVIDLGFSEFLLKDNDDNEYRVVVKAGEAQDLGQVMVNLPSDEGN